MFKKIALTLIGIVLVVGGLAFAKLGQFKAMAAAAEQMRPPPETVTATPVRQDRWERTISAIGTMSAVRGVTVSAETGGRIQRIAFESGAAVEAGQVLVELDTSTEVAQRRSAEAAAALATANLQRTTELAKRKLVSPAEVDTARAQAREAEAQVQIVRAALALKTIRAPFAGKLGISQVQLGQVLRQGDPVVALQTVDPIHVDFALPQQALAQVAAGQVVRVTTDAAPGERFEGRVNAVSPLVDEVSRTARVQARVPNPAGRLRAGMFVNVDVVLPDPRDVLMVPATAVNFAPFGNSVFVIEPAQEGGDKPRTLRQQFVQLGERRGDFVEVLGGVKAGDEVVTSGVFKLRSGMPVQIDNTLAPKPELAPRPANT
ncbi:MAG: efflux RND transporter periplasmic adaptor subunit [Burkholderiaceae bacterium]